MAPLAIQTMLGCAELDQAQDWYDLGGQSVKKITVGMAGGHLVALSRPKQARYKETFFRHSIEALQKYAWTKRVYTFVGSCMEGEGLFATLLETTRPLHADQYNAWMDSMPDPWPAQVQTALLLLDALVFLNSNKLILCDGYAKNYAIRDDGSWMISDVDDLADMGSKAGKCGDPANHRGKPYYRPDANYREEFNTYYYGQNLKAILWKAPDEYAQQVQALVNSAQHGTVPDRSDLEALIPRHAT